MNRWLSEESIQEAGLAGKSSMQRRDFFKLGMSVAGVVGTRVGFDPIAAAAPRSERSSGLLDAASYSDDGRVASAIFPDCHFNRCSRCGPFRPGGATQNACQISHPVSLCVWLRKTSCPLYCVSHCRSL